MAGFCAPSRRACPTYLAKATVAFSGEACESLFVVNGQRLTPSFRLSTDFMHHVWPVLPTSFRNTLFDVCSLPRAGPLALVVADRSRFAHLLTMDSEAPLWISWSSILVPMRDCLAWRSHCMTQGSKGLSHLTATPCRQRLSSHQEASFSSFHRFQVGTRVVPSGWLAFPPSRTVSAFVLQSIHDLLSDYIISCV
jgi:hypothetical protein